MPESKAKIAQGDDRSKRYQISHFSKDLVYRIERPRRSQRTVQRRATRSR